MKYSVVLHVKGPSPKDCSIYVTDRTLYSSPSSSEYIWRKVGLVQNLHFKADVHSANVDFSFGFNGLDFSVVEEPDWSSGIVIFCDEIVGFDGKISIPNIGSVVVFNGTSEPKTVESYFSNYINPLTCVQEISLDTDVKTNSLNLDITGVKSEFFRTECADLWSKSLPEWVNVNIINLDNLLEIGTDGAIDTLSENVIKRDE